MYSHAEDCFGVTPKPARETRALPEEDGTLSDHRLRRLALQRAGHPAKCRSEQNARATQARQSLALPICALSYSPSREVTSGSFFRRKRNQLFQVLRMLSRGVR
jgi:hypothetical protein